MDAASEALKKHREWQGKLETVNKMPIETADDLSIAYTPGVAAPCLEIARDPSLSYVYTREWQGKLETVNKMPIETADDLSIAYTPGVAAPCLEIARDPSLSYVYTGRGHTIETADDLSIAYTPGVAAPCLEIARDPSLSYVYTGRGHTIAVISDGSAVLGLGNIGPEAGMPVMEGKCVLFKALSGLDAVPLVLDTQDTDRLVDVISALAPSFGGINLEDIAAPRCFEVERRLKEQLDIPVFHDDQHGTAIVVSAALENALKLAKKENPRIVINGAGSAGCAIARLLLDRGQKDVILVDRQGILTPDMELTSGQRALIDRLNPSGRTGTLQDALAGADVLIGVSAGHIVSQDMIRSMNEKPIVFAMANPTPEIEPEDAS